jgi:hypothetical protein
MEEATLEHEDHSLGLPPALPLLLSIAHKKRTAAMLSSSADTTGLMHWRAGSLLAHLLACRAPALLAGARVVELGCGSALLSCVARASGAASVLATDASGEALALAAHNLARNAPSAAAGGAGAAGAAAACPARTAELHWGAPAAGSRGKAPMLSTLGEGAFDLAVASEVFYHHRGGGLIEGGIGAQADALFSTAMQQLLTPCTCAAAAAAAAAAPPCGAGLLLLAYSPRYPTMARALRASASALGIALRTISRPALLTPQMRAAQAHTDTRLLAACACAGALAGHVLRLGSPPCAPMCEDSEWEEGAWDAGWETADAQGLPGGIGLEALFT